MPRAFPSKVLRFPRKEWEGVVFCHPVFDPAEVGLMCQWAGREASQRWALALDTGNLELVDEVDFAVGVLDKVSEL